MLRCWVTVLVAAATLLTGGGQVLCIAGDGSAAFEPTNPVFECTGQHCSADAMPVEGWVPSNTGCMDIVFASAPGNLSAHTIDALKLVTWPFIQEPPAVESASASLLTESFPPWSDPSRSLRAVVLII